MAFVCTHLDDVTQDGEPVYPTGDGSAFLDSISSGVLTIPKNAFVIVTIGLGEGDFFANSSWDYAISGLGLVWTDYRIGPGFLHNGALSQNRKVAVFTALSNPTTPLTGRVSVTSTISLPIFSWSMSVDMIMWDDLDAGVIPIARQSVTNGDRNPASTTVDLSLPSNLADTESALFGLAYTDSLATPTVTTTGFEVMASVSHTDVNGDTNLMTAFRSSVNAITDKHFATSKSSAVGWAMINIEISQTATNEDVCDDPLSIIVSGSTEGDLYTGRLSASTFDKFRVVVQQNTPITTFISLGEAQVFTVPAGVTELTCELWGARGEGNSPPNANGVRGLGGYVKATIDVTPGEQLIAMVGGAGSGQTGGTNGGGSAGGYTAGGFAAGGATDIRRPPGTMADRLLVAGGGGGMGGNSSGGSSGNGGDGGYPTGGDGTEPGAFGGGTDGNCGHGGTQTAGGAGGNQAGSAGIGGSSHTGTGFGLGVAAGGGGGGLYGGGGATPNTASATCGGGGGSSGCPDPTARDIVYQNGVNNGSGSVKIWGRFENYTFHRTEDKGRTWEPISAPDDTYINDNQHSNYVVAVDDNGTVHAVRLVSGTYSYWSYVGTSWVGPYTIATGVGDAVNHYPVYLGSDGSTLVLITGVVGGFSRAYKSVDGGVTWAIDGSGGSGDPLPFLGSGAGVHVAWIGSRIHLVYSTSSIPYSRYRYLDPATMIWSAPIVAPDLDVASVSNEGLQPRIFSANGSTSHLYIVQMLGTSQTLNLFASSDSGANWSTVVKNEVLPSSWRATNFLFANCGVNLGSDNRLHVYGSSTDDGTGVLRTISRNLSSIPDWSDPLVVGIPPNGGQRRATTPNNYSQMFPLTRRDGYHSRKYDVIGMFYLGSQLTPPTEVLQLRCVGRQGFIINRITFGGTG